MFCSTLKKILRQYSGTNTLGLTKVITALLFLGWDSCEEWLTMGIFFMNFTYFSSLSSLSICSIGIESSVQIEQPSNQLVVRMHGPWPCSFSASGYWNCCYCCALQANELAVCLNKNSGSCTSRPDVDWGVRQRLGFVILRCLMFNHLWHPICSLWQPFEDDESTAI